MNASDNPEPSPPKHRLRPWTRRLWIAALAGLLIAAAPFAVALVGLALDNQYLMTYHWLVYFSVPVGLPRPLFACLAAGVMTVRDRSRNTGKSRE